MHADTLVPRKTRTASFRPQNRAHSLSRTPSHPPKPKPKPKAKPQPTAEEQLSRFGPIERSIRTEDWDLLVSEIESRTKSDPSDPDSCWIWTGSLRANGYAYVGRAERNRLVHRIVAWAYAGFNGEIREFPEVHHTCGRKACVNPTHLLPTTSLINILEARVRNAVLRRNRALEDAVRQIFPAHPLLSPEWELKDIPEVTMAQLTESSESRRSRLRRLDVKTAYERSLEVHRANRFQQVLAVDTLFAKGATRKDSLKGAGMSRQAYDDWSRRLRSRLA